MDEPLILVSYVRFSFLGVSYSTLDMDLPYVVSTWPGNDDKVAGKVPTQLCYRAGCRGSFKWGFECPPLWNLNRGMGVIDCFKLDLDPDFRREREAGSQHAGFLTEENVQMWFIDFLTSLREYIVPWISNEISPAEPLDWDLRNVEYNFSFPTTWTDPGVLDTFGDLVRRAGFGKSESHSVRIEMPEAMAAAAYTAKWFRLQEARGKTAPHHSRSIGFKPGHVILVCDSGGGTTDISVVKVVAIDKFKASSGKIEEILRFRQLGKVDAKAVGSVRIDEAFRDAIETRLRLIRDRPGEDGSLSAWAAHDMAASDEFQGVKTKFGSRIERDLSNFYFTVPELGVGFHDVNAGIVDGMMEVVRDEIRTMFDDQIELIFTLIDEQLRAMRDLEEEEKVTHFVISGGLGSSEYVQNRIRQHYGTGEDAKHILTSQNPQLAVCCGLVIDRVHTRKYGQSIILQPRSSLSFGIIFNKSMHGNIHSLWNKHLNVSPFDDRPYAVNQIHWFIKKSQTVHRNTVIAEKFYRLFDATSPEVTWTVQFAMSSLSPDRLPSDIKGGGANVFQRIQVRLDTQKIRDNPSLVKKHRRFRAAFRRPQKSIDKFQYEVRANVGMADLQLEVAFAGMVIGQGPLIPMKWEFIEKRDDRPDLVDWGDGGYMTD
ncbi:hypothetical protein AJ80_00887 [Polytolypa hystricis UAMH7299]|uniref:Hsp70-like protein n=1 Tax=Polytolypa hystricis (strain UAMH7299) TaxID=1447883 RepID=A0A2B7Z2E9_POLH7|nr:hypothetical protein AJ80_00887 [Polytolypa hystricis UAMH7299]